MTTKDKINDLKDTAICRICNTNNIEEVNDILNEEIEKALQSQKQNETEFIRLLKDLFDKSREDKRYSELFEKIDKIAKEKSIGEKQ